MLVLTEEELVFVKVLLFEYERVIRKISNAFLCRTKKNNSTLFLFLNWFFKRRRSGRIDYFVGDGKKVGVTVAVSERAEKEAAPTCSQFNSLPHPIRGVSPRCGWIVGALKKLVKLLMFIWSFFYTLFAALRSLPYLIRKRQTFYLSDWSNSDIRNILIWCAETINWAKF